MDIYKVFKSIEYKYLKVFRDKYIIYDDSSLKNIYFTYEYEFYKNQPNLINNTYKIAYVGCIYHCG